jgi:hypothetical protein
MRVLAQQVPKPVDDLSDLQQQMEHLPHIERVSEALRHTILAFGDGIAWKIMRYDRAALTIYGRGQRVAHFAERCGLAGRAPCAWAALA